MNLCSYWLAHELKVIFQRNRRYNAFYQIYDSEGTPIGANVAVDDKSTQYNAAWINLSDQSYLIMWREFYRATFYLISSKSYNV